MSSPAAGEPTEANTLAQARRMTGAGPAAGAGDGGRDVRVPVSRDSLADIVDGGVKLPSGVDQMLFVVHAK